MGKKKESTNLIITELFLVKADWTRTFLGEIRREVDDDENPIIIGKVIISQITVWSSAEDEEGLRKKLDSICKMILDEELHSNSGKTLTIAGNLFFLN